MKCPICHNEEAIELEDKNNPVTMKIQCPECGTFYMEYPYRERFDGYVKIYSGEKAQKVIDAMRLFLSENKLVVFVDNYEKIMTKAEGAVFLEFQDIADRAHVYYENCNCCEYKD